MASISNYTLKSKLYFKMQIIIHAFLAENPVKWFALNLIAVKWTLEIIWFNSFIRQMQKVRPKEFKWLACLRDQLSITAQPGVQCLHLLVLYLVVNYMHLILSHWISLNRIHVVTYLKCIWIYYLFLYTWIFKKRNGKLV